VFRATPDLDPEVEQTWVRPRGRDRYPESAAHDLPSSSPFAATPIRPAVSSAGPGRSARPDSADVTDTATRVEPVAQPRSAVSAISRAAGDGGPDRASLSAAFEPVSARQDPPAVRPRGRRASPVLDPEAEAAERLAADRATLAAQGEALRRVAQRRRESDAVRPRPSIEGAQQMLPSRPAPSPVAAPAAPTAPASNGGRRLIAGGVFDRPLEERAPEPDPADVATRAIAVVRQAAVEPAPVDAADPEAGHRTLVMGILNVTLDSFSDGGRYARFDDAIAHARMLAADGADIIDVGGESTRPGAPRVEVHEEQRRVIPVIRELTALGMRVSVDTMNAATAFAAVEAGAEVINDVSGGLADPNMTQVVVDTDSTYIAMHWRGHSAGMQQRATYANAVAEVKAELFQRVGELVVRGVDPARIVIDPGLGFAKLADHNWQLLGHLHELDELGVPILVAASRKRFLGGLLAEDAGVRERDPATAVISALAAQAGAWGVRVHDVASTRAALDVWEAWQRGSRD
jgi:dihydropteroate synthase